MSSINFKRIILVDFLFNESIIMLIRMNNVNGKRVVISNKEGLTKKDRVWMTTHVEAVCSFKLTLQMPAH